jgi:hypothetical protein
MKYNHGALIIIAITFIFFSGCGQSENSDMDINKIPVYFNAESSQSLQQQLPGGILGGSLKQYSSNDSYTDIVQFYQEALNSYDTQNMSHTSELGRQTVFSINNQTGIITVAIQEFTEEDTVNITIMEAGF